ncbi:MAG: hypothetical protein HON43_03555 [Alphaproteobacteria bacterium]|nr:hypothetical protein [Alphaproteobacteria bacterium]MBT5389898.1 hypothetical protein [Alphaproteobacteria bacterium]
MTMLYLRVLLGMLCLTCFSMESRSAGPVSVSLPDFVSCIVDNCSQCAKSDSPDCLTCGEGNGCYKFIPMPVGAAQEIEADADLAARKARIEAGLKLIQEALPKATTEKKPEAASTEATSAAEAAVTAPTKKVSDTAPAKEKSTDSPKEDKSKEDKSKESGNKGLLEKIKNLLHKK